MDFKEYNGVLGRKRETRTKENIYYCILREKYDSNIKFHKPFCTKALSKNACIHFVIKSAIILQLLKGKLHRESHEGVEEPRRQCRQRRVNLLLVCGVPITLNNQKQFKLFVFLLKEHENPYFVLLPKKRKEKLFIYGALWLLLT